MNTFTQFITANGIEVLEGFDRNAALDAGIPKDKVNAWARTYDSYFGPTTSPSKQREARESAMRGRHSLDKLVMVERELRAVKDNRARNKLRLDLLALTGTYQELMAMVKTLVPKALRRRKRGVRFTASRDRMRTMMFTADEETIADIEHALSRGLDTAKDAMEQMVARLLAILRGDPDTGIPRAVRRPIVLVPAPDYARIMRDDGNDILFHLTDGTTVTGAELAASGLLEATGIELALIHPNHGPVNTYRGQRYANDKQRDLAKLANPMCPVPDCRHSADTCEIHHIQPWSRGGETNMDNLTVLCRYHNQINNDDPGRKHRTKRNPGRIELRNGERTWVSPNGYPVPNTTHPGATQQLFGE